MFIKTLRSAESNQVREARVGNHASDLEDGFKVTHSSTPQRGGYLSLAEGQRAMTDIWSIIASRKSPLSCNRPLT